VSSREDPGLAGAGSGPRAGLRGLRGDHSARWVRGGGGDRLGSRDVSKSHSTRRQGSQTRAFPVAPAGPSPSWWRRSRSPSGRTTGGWAIPDISACAPTSHPPRWCASYPPD